MKQLLSYDLDLFKHINYNWQNGFFDWLMPWLRNAEMWYPLYLFLLLLVTINYKKNGWWWVLFFAVTVATANFVSSSIIKEHIARLRPCNEPSIAGWVRVLVGYRPQSSSFTSSHATNHFAMGMFLYVTLKNQFGKWPMLFLLWAFFISFAQVYVGVHYPLDVTCGALIGILIGYLSGKSFNRNYGLL
ncbi:phosphatase PAP2 family protein [Ferruginibacter sp. SUN106]|uniref:phosphatase PAP2 family protein n=1 Tax=Ferruginibacter sp. SUN106 TaxID=2978348 RepID=UPI003D35BEF3